MHKLCYAVEKEIDEIVENGITISNLEILGELVDIRKDIENIWYWRGYDEYNESTNKNNENTKSKGVDELINDVKILNEKLKSTDSIEISNQLKSKAQEMYKLAESIKHAYEDIKLDNEMSTKFKNLYK